MRFRYNLIFSSIFLVIAMGMISIFFPGEEGIRSYTNLVSDAGLGFIFGQIGTDSPGWTFWVGFQINSYLYMILAVTSILIGSRIIPTKEHDAIELFLGSNPQSARKYYLENIFASIIVLVIALIPSFILLSILSIYHNSADIIGRLFISYTFTLVVGIVLLLGTSMFAILRFSSTTGKIVGFGYLIAAFVIEFSANTSPDYRQYSNFSINYYVNSSSGLLSGKFDWGPVYVLMGISFVFLMISYLIVKNSDYIEKTSNKKSRQYRIFPTISPTSKISQKFPLMMEQLRVDLSYLLGWTLVLIWLVLYTMAIYPGEEAVDELFNSFDMPLVRSLLYGHQISGDYNGWMIYEFHSANWVYYGLFVLFIAASIPNREVRTNSQDILWANNVRSERVILSRTIIMLLEYSILLWSVFISKIIFETLLDKEIDHFLEFQTFILYWIHYSAFGIFVVALSMLPQVSKGRMLAIITYFYFIIINLTAYSGDYEFLKYLGFFGYIDPAGMMLGVLSFGTELLKNIILLVFSILLFGFSLLTRYRNADLV